MRLITTAIVCVTALAWRPWALAVQETVEFEGAPFSMGVQRRIGVKLLPIEDQAGYALAAVLPQDTASLDLVELKWPKSSRTCTLAVARSGVPGNRRSAAARTSLALLVKDGEPQRLAIEPALSEGIVGRICVWCTRGDEQGDLIVLCSLGASAPDARICAFAVSPDGSVHAIDTGNAATLFGWFDCTDLDDDGTYELITARSLDGMAGGFEYHAVRQFDVASSKYLAAPDKFHPFFSDELAWLEWVVETRAAIQADPQKYLNTSQDGPAYQATYQGRSYGFDSVVELPQSAASPESVNAYNAERRKAFELVRAYRDQLRAWLGGGAQPSAWKIAG